MVPAAIARVSSFPGSPPTCSNPSKRVLARTISPERETRNSSVNIFRSSSKESSLDMKIKEKYPHRFVESVINSSFNSQGGSDISCSNQERSHDPSGK